MSRRLSNVDALRYLKFWSFYFLNYSKLFSTACTLHWEILIYYKGSKVLLTIYMSSLTLLVILISLFIFTFFLRRESVMRSVVIIKESIDSLLLLSHEFEQFGSMHMIVCSKEIYRPQRDSNPVLPGFKSTTLPVSYPGTRIIYIWFKEIKIESTTLPVSYPGTRIIYIWFKTLKILVKIEMEHIVNFLFQDILMFIVYFITNIMYVLMYI